jgi:glycine/sarcosine N-methyltransferase
MNMDSVLNFYEQLANNYHLIFEDWEKTVLWQGQVLDKLIRKSMIRETTQQFSMNVLDCSCGIGTQAIGLAQQGYLVDATDLSPNAVEQARINAEYFGVKIKFGVADIRTLTTQIQGKFDVVITCDNSLPHLLTDDDLLVAAKNLKSKLKPNGLLLASIRDYDQAIVEKPRSTIPRVFDGNLGRRIIFQVWDWSDDERTYQVHHFIVRNIENKWQTEHCTTYYRILLRDELTGILQQAGFSSINWLQPEESGYYQPVVLARKKEL